MNAALTGALEAAPEAGRRPAAVLFFMRNFRGYFRVFEPALRLMGERGHRVHLAYDDRGTEAERAWAQELSREYPSISFGPAPNLRADVWHRFGRNIRLSLDYVRFLRPEFRQAPDLRLRAAKRAPRSMVVLTGLPVLRSRAGVAMVTRILTLMERAIPSSRSLEEFLVAQKPDVVMFTPLLTIGSLQPAYLRSARKLGLRTMVCVASWDNLSSKSLIRTLPDLVTVWNETQKQEAVILHGIPPERVVATGAQAFDHWFEWPARPRDEFCRRVGLDETRPFILYLCSSLFASRIAEAEFVVDWIGRLRRGGDPALAECSILIRPHPKRNEEWNRVDLSQWPNVVLWPRVGVMPVDRVARADYYDSLYHSTTVVGLNTSALLEAAIVGRSVHTLHPEEFRGSQDGTLHFRYLTEVAGGFLRVARTFEEHVEQLSAALAAGAGRERPRRFLEAFIRPNGLEIAASPCFVDCIESLAARPPQPALTASPALRVLGLILYPFALRSTLARGLEKVRARRLRDGRPASRPRVLGHLAADALRKGVAALTLSVPALPWAPPPASPRRGKAIPLESGTSLWKEEAVAVKKALLRMARTERPILVGPWVGTVGFELLYWIPFLQWACEYAELDPARVVAVSRGGAARWYRHVAARYADILDHCSPEALRAQNERRPAVQGEDEEHQGVDDFDRQILDRVRVSLGLGDVELLHPSTMSALFSAFWHKRAPMKLVRSYTSFRAFDAMDRPDVTRALPKEFVAVKFDGSPAFPATEENRLAIVAFLRDLAATSEVVLLDSGVLDGHTDFPGLADRLHRIDHLVKPPDNLEVQTAVIAKARAFVGTCGGFSYLAPLCGVDALALYSEEKFRPYHLDLARRVLKRPKFGSLVALDAKDLSRVRLDLGEDGGPPHTAAQFVLGGRGAAAP